MFDLLPSRTGLALDGGGNGQERAGDVAAINVHKPRFNTWRNPADLSDANKLLGPSMPGPEPCVGLAELF